MIERERTMLPVTPRNLRVAEIIDLSPTLRRFVFTGEELGEFTSAEGKTQPAFNSPVFDDHIKIFFTVDPERGFAGANTDDNGVTRAGRHYSARHFDKDSLRLTVDFVVHDGGPGGEFARDAIIGDEIRLGGPRVSHAAPTGYDWIFIAADESAIPPVARFLETLPADTKGVVLLEVYSTEHEIALEKPTGVEIRWVHRGDTAPGEKQLLTQAAQEVEWLPGDVYAWIGCEAADVEQIRSFLLEEHGVAKEALTFKAYWKKGVAG